MHLCEKCGTNLGLTLEIKPEIRSLLAGAFDDPLWFEKNECEVRHVYMRSHRKWVVPSVALNTFHAYFD